MSLKDALARLLSATTDSFEGGNVVAGDRARNTPEINGLNCVPPVPPMPPALHDASRAALLLGRQHVCCNCVAFALGRVLGRQTIVRKKTG